MREPNEAAVRRIMLEHSRQPFSAEWVAEGVTLKLLTWDALAESWLAQERVRDIMSRSPEEAEVREYARLAELWKDDVLARICASWLAQRTQRRVIEAARKVDGALRDDFSSYDEREWVTVAAELRAALVACGEGETP